MGRKTFTKDTRKEFSKIAYEGQRGRVMPRYQVDMGNQASIFLPTCSIAGKLRDLHLGW